MQDYDITCLYNSGVISWLDLHFAKFMGDLNGGAVPELTLAAAMVSSYTGQGHICIDLSSLGEKKLYDSQDEQGSIVCPLLEEWVSALRDTNVVGRPGEYRPLILDNKHRLYLFRYWDYQDTLASLIKRRLGSDDSNIDIELLKEGLNRDFPGENKREVNWQKCAAIAAVTKRFCVIAGGPGTGKTTTVIKILSLIQEQANEKTLNIALTAPTGKAAARLKEVIQSAKKGLQCSDTVKRAIPEDAETIHRLLKSVPHSPYFRYNSENLLPVDVMVVDEASMVDMALMTKLVQALPLESRLIVLGDKDQLASVEAGAVFGDICAGIDDEGYSRDFSRFIFSITGYKIPHVSDGKDVTAMRDPIIQLGKNYRFTDDSGISQISSAVNAGDSEKASRLLMSGEFEDISWRRLPSPTEITRSLRERILQEYGKYLRAENLSAIFQLFEGFRILCALRKGPYGSVSINVMAEQALRREGLINLEGEWYIGRPVMITRNDYNLQLYNGDIGIALVDEETNGEIRVFFQGTEGHIRKFHPLSLPDHETVFAMTVHKSQGSEFDKILLILSDRESPILTREIIYTGITRAKKNVEIWGREDVFTSSVTKQITRTSGLRDELWSL